MKIFPGIHAGSYAVTYELQVWRVWVGIYKKRFRKTSGWGFIRWAPKD